MRKTNKFIKFFIYLFSALLVVGVLGGITFFVMDKEGVSYYVKNENKIYMSNSDYENINLVGGKQYKFFVGSLKKESFYYSVDIIPNSNNDFTFLKDGQIMRFSETGSYADFFNIQTYNDNFIITAPFDNIKSLIEKKVGGTVEFSKQKIQSDYYFIINITFNHGKSACRLLMSFNNKVLSVKLNKDEIIF